VNKQWKKAAIWAAAAGLCLVAILAFLFIPFDPAAAALDDQLEEVAAATDLPATSLPILIARIIRVFLGVLGIIFIVLVIYAGYLYLTAHGEDDPIKKAKKILKNAIIGLFIILSSFAITTFILNALLSAAGLGGGVSTAAVNYSEPLSGSLGAGIIESHYPPRNALDIPRNTKIMITFKEPIDFDSIADYSGTIADDPAAETFPLNSNNVLIYKTADVTEEVAAADVALGSTKVIVSFTADQKTFVFDPVDYLGSENEDTNYTVFLGPGIQKIINDDGDTDKAFSGSEADGYAWTFEVSTEIDLTPPTVVSVIPVKDSIEARNIVVQITFSEAMDPVVASGTFDGTAPDFTNISVMHGIGEAVKVNTKGTSSISNQYRTAEFLPDDECGKDPCGSTIYCLPGSEGIQVIAKAAEVSTQPPQATISGGLPTGLADAAGNALDGNDNWGEIESWDSADYFRNFTTTAEINNTVPFINWTIPSLDSNEEIDLDDDVEVGFSMDMLSSTLNTSNIRLETDYDSADPSEEYQNPWFTLNNETIEETTTEIVDEEEITIVTDSYSKALISHATLWESVTSEGGSVTDYYYYPVIKNDVESKYQICMFPSFGPKASSSTETTYTNCVPGDGLSPYCCQGLARNTPCTTKSGKKLGQ